MQRASRIPISTRHRSPSPPVVVYKKAQNRNLNDLRWYCLARKFSILWQKFTFGCHLRRIKSYYRAKELRKYFILWKQTIFENQLEERALKIYEHRLLRNAFQFWFTSTIQERDDIQLADEHFGRKRLSMAWMIWRQKLFERQKRNRQYTVAAEKYNRSLVIRVGLHS